jgi:site-specific recombinase XerD
MLKSLSDVAIAPDTLTAQQSLPHTYATLLLGHGVHPKLVQHLVAHASITMTLDRCTHWIPSMGRHAADGMDEALG